MVKQYLITFRSVTYAQQAQKILKGATVSASLQRTPRELTQRGCGYCLRLRAADAPRAVDALREKGMDYSGIYAVDENGRPEERQV